MLRTIDSLYWRGRGWVQGKVNEFLYKEDGDVNIVSIVVIIGIVIIIAGVFRTQIKELIETLFTSIKENAKKAIKE